MCYALHAYGMFLDIWADRSIALNSHHFVTICAIAVSFPRTRSCTFQRAADTSSLQCLVGRRSFSTSFVGSVGREERDVESLQQHADRVSSALANAATYLPCGRPPPRKPWISAHTMGLIEQRNACRTASDYAEEKHLNKEIRPAARTDRRAWLYSSLQGGTWAAIKQLRQGSPKKHATIRA